jgi:hypothetical protein
MQVEGYLAIQNAAVPTVVIDRDYAVRDVSARLGESATGAPVVLRVTVNDAEYCTLTIPADANDSEVVDGFALPPLRSGSRVGLDVVSLAQGGGDKPGRDLTVTVRL